MELRSARVEASKAATDETDGIEKRWHKRHLRENTSKPHTDVSQLARNCNRARKHALGNYLTAKWCTVCLLDKDLSDFAVHKGSAAFFVRRAMCSSCTNSRQRQQNANCWIGQSIQRVEDAVATPEEMQIPGTTLLVGASLAPSRLVPSGEVVPSEALEAAKAAVDEAHFIEYRRRKRRKRTLRKSE